MTNTPNGVKCDKCGVAIPGGGVDKAIVAVDVSDEGQVLTYHFCRNPNGGCAKVVLSRANLAAKISSGEEIGLATPDN